MKYKSIFISDLHLGNKFSQADILLNFLKKHKSENLFLIGDIIDGYALKRKFRWKHSYSKVIQELFKKAKNGTKIYRISGNHDGFLREFTPFDIEENIKVVDEMSYIGVNGKKYLLTHGDFFDSLIASIYWMPKLKLGVLLYVLILYINSLLSKILKLFGLKKRITLSRYVKTRFKRAEKFINHFENVLVEYAKEGGYDGVICGHIHKAAIKEIDGINYLNCGDFIDSYTAILETKDGKIFLYDYLKK